MFWLGTSRLLDLIEGLWTSILLDLFERCSNNLYDSRCESSYSIPRFLSSGNVSLCCKSNNIKSPCKENRSVRLSHFVYWIKLSTYPTLKYKQHNFICTLSTEVLNVWYVSKYLSDGEKVNYVILLCPVTGTRPCLFPL